MRVKGGDDQVDEMDGEGEIKHELGAGYQEENEDGARICQQSACVALRCVALAAGAAYLVRLFSIQMSARVQPTVVSPRRVSQLNSKSRLTSLPATRAVKTMSTPAHA